MRQEDSFSSEIESAIHSSQEANSKALFENALSAHTEELKRLSTSIEENLGEALKGVRGGYDHEEKETTENLLMLTRQQLEELKKLNSQEFSGEVARQTVIEPQDQHQGQFAYRGQTQASPYSVYTNEMDMQAKASGHYMPTPDILTSKTSEKLNDDFNNYRQGIVKDTFYSMFPDRRRMGYQERDALAMQNSQRLTEAGVAGAGAFSSYAGYSAAAPALKGLGLGGIPIMAGGIAAGAIAGGITNVGLDQLRTHHGYNEYLMNNSSMIMDSYNSTNDRGLSGFSLSDTHEASSFLRHQSAEHYMDDEEISSLLGIFTETGMLRRSNDIEDFKKRFSDMTEIVRESALMLNESYEEVAALMGEMERRGVLSENFDYFSSKMKSVGNMVGKDPMDVVNQIMPGVQQNLQGTSGDTMREIDAAAGDMLIVDHLYQTGINAEEGTRERRIHQTISNMGEEQAANLISRNREKNVSMGIPQFFGQYVDYDPESGSFSFDSGAMSRDIEAGVSADEMSRMSQNAIGDMPFEVQEKLLSQGGIEELYRSMSDDQRNAANVAQKDLMVDLDGSISSREELIRRANPELSAAEVDLILSATREAEHYDTYQSKMTQDAISERLIAKNEAHNMGPAQRISRAYDSAKNWAGTPFAWGSNQVSRIGQGVRDWWMGTDRALHTNHNYEPFDFDPNTLSEDVFGRQELEVSEIRDSLIDNYSEVASRANIEGQDMIRDAMMRLDDESLQKFVTTGKVNDGMLTSMYDKGGMFERLDERYTEEYRRIHKDDSVSKTITNSGTDIIRELEESDSKDYDMAREKINSLSRNANTAEEREAVQLFLDRVDEVELKDQISGLGSDFTPLGENNASAVSGVASALHKISEYGGIDLDLDTELRAGTSMRAGGHSFNEQGNAVKKSLQYLATEKGRERIKNLSGEELRHLEDDMQKVIDQLYNSGLTDTDIDKMAIELLGEESSAFREIANDKELTGEDRMNALFNTLMSTSKVGAPEDSESGAILSDSMGESSELLGEIENVTKDNNKHLAGILETVREDRENMRDFIKMNA